MKFLIISVMTIALMAVTTEAGSSYRYRPAYDCNLGECGDENWDNTRNGGFDDDFGYERGYESSRNGAYEQSGGSNLHRDLYKDEDGNVELHEDVNNGYDNRGFFDDRKQEIERSGSSGLPIQYGARNAGDRIENDPASEVIGISKSVLQADDMLENAANDVENKELDVVEGELHGLGL